MIQKYTQDHVLKPTGNDFEFNTFGKKLQFVATDAAEVSSTWLREKMSLKELENAKDFIAPNVQDYILRNKLYGN